MKRIIHKRKWSRFIVAEEVLCGRWVQHPQTTYHWGRVTCKNCLKLKKRWLNFQLKRGKKRINP